MQAVWPIVVALLTGPSGDRPAVTVVPHVRAAANAAALLSDAAARSATVRGLVGRLDATDVIVYIESPRLRKFRRREPSSSPSPHTRFLRIGLKNSLPPFDVTPLIAHELQHAVEIAENPGVRDEEALRRCIGASAISMGPTGSRPTPPATSSGACATSAQPLTGRLPDPEQLRLCPDEQSVARDGRTREARARRGCSSTTSS